MDSKEIRTKAEELKSILSASRGELSILEKELLNAVGEYQKALNEEKIREIKQTLDI
ncbi:MAG: hypothetical protein JWO73_557 [Candidatus Taylorbacteria bacterium]|nr:hypothetical protein [Candidatus Taylorbacteria bacterium]